jgi:TonB family protein
MMDEVIISNVLRWCLQGSSVAVIGAVLPRVFRVDDPAVRHLYWRTLLALCLFLPLVLPREPAEPVSIPDAPSQQLSVGEQNGPVSARASSAPEGAHPVPRSRRSSSHWIAVALLAGILARVGWICAGVLRLRRLRMAGERARCQEHDELQSLLQTTAEICFVARLDQPVTFGVFRPVLLLPDTIRDMPQSVRQAVIAHELWHVRRRDWIWVLVEEGIRAALWFHPAVWWLVSEVRSSREEVVDELTVRVTKRRRSYIEALLAFADEPRLVAVAPFARRRRLFRRIALLSRGTVMSSKRVVASCAVMLVMILLAGWYGAAALPLRAASSGVALDSATLSPNSTGASLTQAPVRDGRAQPSKAAPAREEELKQTIASSPRAPKPYFELARLQEARGAISDAETTLSALRAAVPNNTAVLNAIVGFYKRQGQFDTVIEALEQISALDPSDPMRHHVIATFYLEKVQKDTALSASEKLTYIQSGIAATDRSLALDPEYVEALVYKNLLLRMQADLEADSATRQRLIAEADRLRNRAVELRRSLSAGRMAVSPPPPPPPPPASGDNAAGFGLIDGQVPLRIGGNIRPPVKIRDVRPEYPEAARASRVTGMVILEAVVDAAGRIADAKVLRSIPLLDAAALDAVRQWEFQPTMLDGRAVPVIMTVTVNFALQ